MFIAMNRFTIVPGKEEIFEDVWKTRESRLEQVPGFVNFLLLKGPEKEEGTLYASHTIWQNRTDFEAWTKSENFRQAHANAGNNRGLYIGHPVFEGFEPVEGI